MTPNDNAGIKTIHQALTGRNMPSSTEDIRGMLQNVYGTVKDGEIHVDTRKVAQYMKVSQRTVQRWMKGTNVPSADHKKSLTKKSRQTITTKRGRARSLKQATKQASQAKKPVTVNVAGLQGPRGYERDRNSKKEISPEEYEQLLASYADGGDPAALEYLTGIYSDRYVDDWHFGDVSGFRIDGFGGTSDRSDPRAI